MTIEFVFEKLFAWKASSFWDKFHKKLVQWNVELPIADGGTGLTPQWKLADASFAASWFQPFDTIARARQMSVMQLVTSNDLNEFEGLPSIQML